MQVQKHNETRLAAAIRPVLENLENRTMLSMTPAATGASDPVRLLGTTLLVVGGDRGDVITLKRDKVGTADVFSATVNKTTKTFGLPSIKAVRVYGYGGSDVIKVDETGGTILTPVYVFAGTGNDTITGGSGNDTLIGCEGNDLIQGNAGNDSIEGNAGNDRILGGDGIDTLFGGTGADLITSGAGKDLVINKDRDVVDTGAAAQVAAMKKKGLAYSPIVRRRGSKYRPADFNSVVVGYTPQQIRNAYQFGDLSDPTFTNRGAGQTIAIVGAYHYPTAKADLITFSREFGIPVPNRSTFGVVFASGVQPVVNPGWALEAALDIQWAHAIAPEARIILVEADTDTAADIDRAIQVAVKVLQPTGGVVSMSFGSPEWNLDPYNPIYYNDSVFDDTFRNVRTDNISFIAAAGDTAAVVNNPANVEEVTSVGGTFLPLDGVGNLTGSEIVWDDGIIGYPDNTGTSGGSSELRDRPTYQEGVIVEGTLIGDARVLPDVAYNADPMSGVAVYSTTPNSRGDTGWQAVGGTSAGAPQWAGIAALVNQKRMANKLPILGGNQFNSLIYGVAKKYYTETFNDVTIGETRYDFPPPPITDPPTPQAPPVIYPATSGFDRTTGWGTPRATNLINRMAVEPVAPVVATRMRIDFNWKARFIREIWPGLVNGAVVNFVGVGNAKMQPTETDVFFSQYANAAGDQIQIDTLDLTRTGNEFEGRGSASVLLADGTPGIFAIAIRGRAYRVNGVDRVLGEFYAVSRRGKILQQGMQPVLRGSFASDKELLQS